MSVADEVEQLMLEYSLAVDMALGSTSNSKCRRLKCGFCCRTYKYHAILTNHIYSNEIFKDFGFQNKTNFEN